MVTICCQDVVGMRFRLGCPAPLLLVVYSMAPATVAPVTTTTTTTTTTTRLLPLLLLPLLPLLLLLLPLLLLLLYYYYYYDDDPITLSSVIILFRLDVMLFLAPASVLPEVVRIQNCIRDQGKHRQRRSSWYKDKG